MKYLVIGVLCILVGGGFIFYHYQSERQLPKALLIMDAEHPEGLILDKDNGIAEVWFNGQMVMSQPDPSKRPRWVLVDKKPVDTAGK